MCVFGCHALDTEPNHEKNNIIKHITTDKPSMVCVFHMSIKCPLQFITMSCINLDEILLQMLL